MTGSREGFRTLAEWLKTVLSSTKSAHYNHLGKAK